MTVLRTFTGQTRSPAQAAAAHGCALALALVALLLAPGTSSAAGPNRYDVWSCRGPLGEPVGTSAWRPIETGAGGDVVMSDSCAGGGALDLSLASGRGFAGSARGSLTLSSPPGTHIDSWTVWRSLAVAPAQAGASYDFAAAIAERGSARSDQGCSTAQEPPLDCLTAGSDSDPADPGNVVDRPGTPVLSALELWVGCVSTVCDDPEQTPARARLWGSRVEVHDISPPARPQLSGSLVEDETVAGEATLVVDGSDEGGGIASIGVAIDGDGEQIAAPAGAGGTCRAPYTVLQPCPTVAARAFRIDTTTLTHGPHTVSGTVVDAAGNATSFGPVAFVVRQPAREDDPPSGGGEQPPPVIVVPPPVILPPPVVVQPPPAASNGSPAVRTARLRLERTTLTPPAGRRVRLRGTLRTADGAPVAGARLTVSAQALGTAAERVRELPDLTTTAAGRFTLLVGGHGAERITIAFAPADGAAATARAAATVRVPASLTIARSRARLRRQQTVVISGRLQGAGDAARGAVVEVQAIVRGRWQTVGTARAAADGRYRWRYRFVRLTRDTIFSFRALVRRTPGWPWPDLHTRTLQVRVDATPRPR